MATKVPTIRPKDRLAEVGHSVPCVYPSLVYSHMVVVFECLPVLFKKCLQFFICADEVQTIGMCEEWHGATRDFLNPLSMMAPFLTGGFVKVFL